jgi:hypothetical protein
MPEDLIVGDTGLPVARELAEMELINNDLNLSLSSLTIWVERYQPAGQKDEKERAIDGSLFRDGITQFVGCFDRNNAYPLVVETVYPNVGGIGPYFRWLRNLRNSYTAHRHGAARQCSIGALVRPGAGQFLGHTKLIVIYAGPSQEEHASLLAIIKMAISYVESRIAHLQQEFMAQASALPPEELLKLPPAPVQPQAPDQIGKSRGEVRKGIARENAETFEPPPRIDVAPA